MNYRNQMLKDYIVRNEQELPESMNYYRDSVEKMRNIKNLARFTKKDAAVIIRPFLYGWGKMGRVLGRKVFLGWEDKIAKQISSNHEMLEKFRKKELSA